ncbi:ubiquitin carboxyl-terminal hydrolase 35 [Tribolium castaneum]|uniref:Ubiquitin carboxyl-terminal hydrolase 38-like Protein n=1 Tax=Tribolium castaneum TaxID=7070 RepID=D6WIN0_TRICA|nr:PREDICTED: ubiquitin carboxyl-terminal hydrolase 35 [Tribolium castaneum]EEZ99989.1 Ubiquitin carboxyl-terminal hydrolase 38-like Protein [Tribolium castaneum]|eukprot:XP_972008.1 PREDICTED: ubiquitin carboxyl-terminal hydrolase 35 [Tribolium castaneum]
MAVKQKVVECVAQSAEARLQLILRTLQDLTAQGLQDKKCANIVSLLGTIHVPTDPSDYKQFIGSIKSVQEILTKECMKNDLVYLTLRSLYHEISTSQKPLSPAMSIVLTLIQVDYIPTAVDWILQTGYSPENHKKALMTLCNWLPKWTWTENLGRLVLTFMQGLEAQQQLEIVFEVTEATIEPLFRLLILPEHRKSVGPIVKYMLFSMLSQSNPVSFDKVVPHVGSVVAYLYKEKSDSSLEYFGDIVKVCFLLMDHFSDYSNRYVQLKKDLEQHLPAANCIENGPSNSVATVYSASGKVGLNNLGNTCYMNSVLQALFMTKPFRNEILLYNKDMTSLLSKLQTLFALLQHSKRASISPHDISNLARPPGFLPGHQHDSSEFLGYLLDVLHEQEKTAVCGNGTKADHVPPSYNTIVQSAFGGRTVSVSRCGECDTKSERVDNFWELQLSFPNTTDNQSVQTLLNYYLQPEKLSGDNQYHCEVCDCLTDGERVTCIEEAPPRLILTLKHFRYDQASQQRTKLLQSIKLDNHVQLDTGLYVLYAAVVHCGSSVDSGHYYTFARDGDEWFKFNDCSVMRTMAEELCSLKPPETPYILFYSRQDCSDPEALPRTVLSQRLQLVINNDHTEFELEKRRRPIKTYNSKQNRNDEPPPPGCGGPGFSSNSSNMYVC